MEALGSVPISVKSSILSSESIVRNCQCIPLETYSFQFLMSKIIHFHTVLCSALFFYMLLDTLVFKCILVVYYYACVSKRVYLVDY